VLRLACALCKNADTAPQPKPARDAKETGASQKGPPFLFPLSDERMEESVILILKYELFAILCVILFSIIKYE